MPAWVFITQLGSKLVLLILFALSIWSVSIMIDRWRIFKAIQSSTTLPEAKKIIENQNWSALAQWVAGQTGFSAGALKAALEVNSHDAEQIDRAVRSYLVEQRSNVEKGFSVLATLGSNAPFIGLFGTVLGIIQAFGMLASQQGASNSVMAGIAEALIATAVGLFVAIPAVVAYNVFTRKLKLLIVESEALRDFYISRRRD